MQVEPVGETSEVPDHGRPAVLFARMNNEINFVAMGGGSIAKPFGLF